MADMLLLQGAITGLKTAADLAIGLGKLHTMSEVQGKAIELQQIILSAQSSALSAQSEQFALIEHIRQLEKEIAEVKAWEETKQRYKLIQPREGSFAYALKADSDISEPAHWICTKCYDDGHKSILQEADIVMRIRMYKCLRCKSEIKVEGNPKYT